MKVIVEVGIGWQMTKHGCIEVYIVFNALAIVILPVIVGMETKYYTAFSFMKLHMEYPTVQDIIDKFNKVVEH